MQPVNLAWFIARTRTFPLKENNRIKLIEGSSKKGRRVQVFRGEKRNPRGKGADEPSFFGWWAANGEWCVVMKCVFGYYSTLTYSPFTLRGYWVFGCVMPGKVSVRNGDAGNPSRL
jgi:hypothetical protein